MASLLPVALYGLKVPAGDVMVPALSNVKSTFRLTMAAIDPSVAPKDKKNGNVPPRATLKIIFDPEGPDSEDDDDDDDEDLDDEQLGLMGEDEDESSSDDEDTNGGPSDPAKSKKARREAAANQIKKALEEIDPDSDEEMDVDSSPKTNGVVSKKKKGKAKALEEDEESESDDGDDEEPSLGVEELVLCTLDGDKNYQQPLDIVVGEDQTAFFKVSGDFDVYLTGNYTIDSSENSVPPGYDMDPDEDELEDEMDSDEESDELDDMEDPRITEVESEDEAPKLIKAPAAKAKEEPAKGKNKRAAEESEDDEATLDNIMAKSLKPEEPATTNGEPKLSKKQLKKLKNNAGKAVEAAAEGKDVVKKEDQSEKSPANGNKKVQFAKNLEQGPTSKPNEEKIETKSNLKAEDNTKSNDTPKQTLGIKTVQGVKIDDRKLGKGPAAKKGDKVGLRYIGKLQADNKVFDANKSGKPFQFTLGSGEVIKGWDIGVQGMTAGSERRITIPANLAYGNKAQPGIPANSTLVFDLKMINVK